jgi:hypothetical protein
MGRGGPGPVGGAGGAGPQVGQPGVEDGPEWDPSVQPGGRLRMGSSEGTKRMIRAEAPYVSTG